MRHVLAANARSRVGILGLAFLILAGTLVAVRHVAAQQVAGTAPWLQLTTVQIEPSNFDEYIAVQREYAARARRLATPGRTVSRTEFGDSYQLVITSPVQNLASFDTAKPADPELTAITLRMQRYVKGQQTYMIRTLPEIDNPLPPNQQPNVMVINIARVFPGREQDYMNVMKSDFLPHFNKANFYHVNGSLTFGGDTGFVHVFYASNFAKLDEGSPVVKALGAAGAQAVTAKFSGIVSSSQQWITRVLPDLSYPAGTGAPPAKP
jgi:hypothetical protein